MHLKQSLEGAALKAIEGLGHTAAAYTKSIEILERKYGGVRRQTAMYIERVDNFSPLKSNNTNELERFSDLLNLLILSFEDSKRDEELKNGVLYMQLQKKLTSALLIQYHRWIHEKKKPESVIALNEFITLESEFHTRAAETINGLTDQKSRLYPVHFIKCAICEKAHEHEHCASFIGMTCKDRWNIARKHKLCYKCLRRGHTKLNCRAKHQCEINDCKEGHHELLHKIGLLKDPADKQPRSHEMEEDPRRGSIIALRTIPVLIHYKGKQVQANALLDDGSMQTFINEDIAKALGMKESNARKISVDVFNGNDVSVYTSEVEFEV